MNKLYHLTLCFILGFGWLFLTPAHSDDPLSVAEQEIRDLRSKISNLNHKDDFISLIEQAEDRYNKAVDLKNEKDNAYSEYNNAVEEESNALSEKNIADTAASSQQTIRDSAYENKENALETFQSAQIAYDAQLAVVNSQITSIPGLNMHVYDCWDWSNSYNASPPLGCNSSPTLTTTISEINFHWGDGGPIGATNEDFQIHVTGYWIPNHTGTMWLTAPADDGVKMWLNNVLVIDDWVDKGGGGSTATIATVAGEAQSIDFWYYENGGGAWVELLKYTDNGWQIIPSNEFIKSYSFASSESLAILEDRETELEEAQNNYNDLLDTYDEENALLISLNNTVTLKTSLYNTAQDNTEVALEQKQIAENAYNEGIINLNLAIYNAWKYYDEQLKRELEIAIAQAIANQPQPEPSPQPTTEPEPSPEPQPSPDPTPEPSPEQTEPDNPTPTPDSETTDKPKPEPTPDPEPTPEPSPEPSPLPTDINPEPTPEPEPTPVAPSPEPSNNSSTEDLSGVIANLTSKDNKLVTLTPEQVAEVSNILSSLSIKAKSEVAKDLGIKTEEVALIAEAMKDNPILATAVVEFSSRAEENVNAPMPYTLADATTELQTEAFLSDPLGALTNIDLDKVLNPSEWGKDMTDDQREKAQEVVIPVIIASNIVAAAMTRRI